MTKVSALRKLSVHWGGGGVGKKGGKEGRIRVRG